MGHLRWLVWGAPRPVRAPRGRFLLGFGIASWLFSLGFMIVVLMGLVRFLGTRWGPVGIVAVSILGIVVMRRLFSGFSGGEVKKMLFMRYKRTGLWLMALGGLSVYDREHG